jgi:hypothetical protein
MITLRRSQSTSAFDTSKCAVKKKLNSISRRREFLSLSARALPLTQTAGIKLYEQLISIIGSDSDYNIISLERVCEKNIISTREVFNYISFTASRRAYLLLVS